MRQRLETVFDWVIAQGWRLDNPAGKAVIRALPRVSRLKRHHRSLPPADVPVALRAVRESTADPPTSLAFEFLVLTAGRSNEVRQATWLEMDLQNAVWVVPAMHMKARRAHWVPLSRRALEILDQARELAREDEGLVFPADRSGKAQSDMTFTVLLRRLDIPAVPHGFRSSFKNWCNGGSDARRVLAEAALAHNLGNQTEASYATDLLLDPRRPLMEEWAEFASPLGGG